MSLPCKVIDRLFARLTVTYGGQFMRNYEGQDPAAVKTSWAHELGMFANRLEPIAWALENLPERCPNVIEFRKICRAMPTTEVLQLPAAKADPARVAATLARLGGVRDSVINAKDGNGKQWAHDLAKRVANKEVLPTLFQRQCLREVLRPEAES